MRKMLLISIGVAFVCAIITVLMKNVVPSGEHILEIKENPGVFVKYGDTEEKITEDGKLYMIRATSEGVMIVEPATLNDCRRTLEENGQG